MSFNKLRCFKIILILSESSKNFMKHYLQKSGFLVTLWTWIEVRIINIGLKLYASVVSTITMSMKKSIVWKHLVCKWTQANNVFYIKWSREGSLSWILIVQTDTGMSFNTPTCHSNKLNFIQSDWKFYRKIGTKVLNFSHSCDPE